MTRQLAYLFSSIAQRILPPGREEWSFAMRAELSHIQEEPAALVFSLGCLNAAVRQRATHVPSVAFGALWLTALVTASLALLPIGSGARGVAIVFGWPDPYLQALLLGGPAERHLAAMYSAATPAVVVCLVVLGIAQAMSALFLVQKKKRAFIQASWAALGSCSILAALILWLGVSAGAIPLLFAPLVLQSISVPSIWRVLP